jgi:hypothetical protein
MRRTIILAVTAAALAGSGLAGSTYAQSPIAGPDAGSKTAPTTRNAPARATREGPTVNQLTANDDARIARLKASLRLTSDQESAWGSVEDALRDISKRRADRVMAIWEEQKKRDPRAKSSSAIERMRQTADAMTQRAEDLKRLADASEPLHEKLDESQKRRMVAQIQNYSMAGGINPDFERRGRRGRHWRWRS